MRAQYDSRLSSHETLHSDIAFLLEPPRHLQYLKSRFEHALIDIIRLSKDLSTEWAYEHGHETQMVEVSCCEPKDDDSG